MSIGQRITGARLAAGFTNAADFARACGVSRQWLNNLEKDRVSKPDPSHLAKLAEVARVDDHWLVTGEGLPERKTRLTEDESAIVAVYRALSPEKQIALMTLLNSMR